MMHYLPSCQRPLRRYPLPFAQCVVSKPTRHVAHAPKVSTNTAISYRPSTAVSIAYLSTCSNPTAKLPTTANSSIGWEPSHRRCSIRFGHTASGSTMSITWTERTMMQGEFRSYTSISQRQDWWHGRCSLAPSLGQSLEDTPYS